MKTSAIHIILFITCILTLCQCGRRTGVGDLGDTIAVSLNRTPYIGTWMANGGATIDSTVVEAIPTDTAVTTPTNGNGAELKADGSVKNINLTRTLYNKWEVFEDSILVLHGTSGKVIIHDTVIIRRGIMLLPDKITTWKRIDHKHKN